MATNAELVTEIQEMRRLIERKAQEPARRAPEHALMGFGPPSDPGEWPIERLERLKVYDMEAASMFLNGGNSGYGGRRRRGLLGWGPMLIKMGALCGISDYRRKAEESGFNANYGEEQFEKEFRGAGKFGPISVRKARQHGVPWEPPGSNIRKAALNEASGTQGGYLIPPQFQSDLLTIQAEEAFIKPRARVQPMNALTVQWPTLDVTTNQGTGISPYFAGIVATWQPEAQLIAESEPAFRLTNWTAYNLQLYAVSSNQLLADNGIGLDAMMTMLFGQAVVWYEEYAYLQGKGAGSSEPQGVINSPCAIIQSRTTTSRFVLKDAANMMSHLQIRGWDGAGCWIIHQSVVPELIQMVGGGTIGTPSTTNIPGNQLVWVNPWTGTGNSGPASMKLPNAFLNGLPLYITEKLPSLGTRGDVMLVNFEHYIIGQRLDTQIDISDHYLFRNNQRAWRVLFRGDGKFWLNGAMTDANGWSISPAVVLAA